MRSYELLTFLCSLGVISALSCSDWFESNPARCKNQVFLKWCPQGSVSVCGNSDDPRSASQSQTSTNTRQTSTNTRTETVVSQTQSDSSDCASWFENDPDRCGKKMYLNWCPQGSKKVCPEEVMAEATDDNEDSEGDGSDESGKKSGEKSGKKSGEKSEKKNKRGSDEENADDPECRGNNGKGKGRGKCKNDKSGKKSGEKSDKKSKEKSDKKSSEGSDKQNDDEDNQSKDEIYKECMREHDVPSSCEKYATYEVFDVKKMGCDNPECVDHLGPMMYCMTNNQDNSRCCRDSGVDSKCKPFCNGKEEVRINVMFASVKSAVQYLPCIQKAKQIGKCNEKGHSGKKAPKKSFREEKLSDQMRKLLENQC